MYNCITIQKINIFEKQDHEAFWRPFEIYKDEFCNEAYYVTWF